ncbi:hypothetical protein EVAR_80018_1 [Eumeta japonica]|uniref:Uncharacterized protein n=1 Tax=Eumeta variegata TaxID=151549 RepID=A0A4C1WLN1_EUMVA|nr:hypothetical protein EVAR_80018_1 [Eumeta japonica]
MFFRVYGSSSGFARRDLHGYCARPPARGRTSCAIDTSGVRAPRVASFPLADRELRAVTSTRLTRFGTVVYDSAHGTIYEYAAPQDPDVLVAQFMSYVSSLRLRR